MTPLANRLADYAVNLQYEDLPRPAVHEAKRRFIDSFATAVGAMDADAYAIARRCAVRVQRSPAPRLLGGGASSVEWATFVNGLLIRYLDYNDTYLSLEPAHPSDNLAAVLAVGEAVGASGQDLITAAVLAYEIQCRLCDAASLRKHGVDHVTYGAISSAPGGLQAAEARRRRKTTHAIGIAGVCNVALRQTRSGELSMWKGCAFANAARNGVFAALLAAEGMTGPAPIFEGDLGFMKLVTREPFDLRAARRRAATAVHDHQDLHQVLAGRVPLAERHRRRPAAAARRSATSRKVTAIDIHTFDAAVRHHRQGPGEVAAARPARRPTTACPTAPPSPWSTAT